MGSLKTSLWTLTTYKDVGGSMYNIFLLLLLYHYICLYMNWFYKLCWVWESLCKKWIRVVMDMFNIVVLCERFNAPFFVIICEIDDQRYEVCICIQVQWSCLFCFCGDLALAIIMRSSILIMELPVACLGCRHSFGVTQGMFRWVTKRRGWRFVNSLIGWEMSSGLNSFHTRSPKMKSDDVKEWRSKWHEILHFSKWIMVGGHLEFEITKTNNLPNHNMRVIIQKHVPNDLKIYVFTPLTAKRTYF